MAAGSAEVAPRRDRRATAATVTTAWSEVLGVEAVAPDADFFASGGNSVLATRLAARLRRELGRELSVRQIFEHPTPASLAAAVEREAAEPLDAPVPVPRGRPLPVRAMQEARYRHRRLWEDERGSTAAPDQNFRATFRLLGDVDADAVLGALDEIGRRHEILRSTIREADGVVVQEAASRSVTAERDDLRPLPTRARDDVLSRLLAADLRAPLDLDAGALFRARLVRMGDQEHVLSLVFDGLAYDGDWSRRVLAAELGELYDARLEARPARLPSLALQQADFASWERRVLSGRRGTELRSYWRARLGRRGPLPKLELPEMEPPTGRPEHRAETVVRQLEPATTEALRRLPQAGELTLFTVGLAAVQITLHAYSGRPEIGVLAAVTLRRWPELEPLIGSFTNFAVFCTDLSGNPTVAEVLGRVRSTVLEANAYAEMPYEELVKAADPSSYANPWRSPVLVFTASDGVRVVPCLKGVEVEEAEGPKQLVHNPGLVLGRDDATSAYHLDLTYDASRLDAAAAARFVEDVQAVLAEVVTRPARRLRDLANSPARA
jgi:hypothetical protein